ncbi:MAG TPA: phosphotriesterase, partial [Candidatus Binatia bacterium]|nr:phosphotriesterase [Candidatus Binatia bacterium]
PAAFVWAHAQDEKNRTFHLQAAESGAWVEFDGISPETVDENISLIREARRAGYLRRVLISQDAAGFHVGQQRGGYSPGFSFLFSEFLPQLRTSGFNEREIAVLMVDNPRSALTPRDSTA